jgi:hypothetical protein
LNNWFIVSEFYIQVFVVLDSAIYHTQNVVENLVYIHLFLNEEATQEAEIEQSSAPVLSTPIVEPVFVEDVEEDQNYDYQMYPTLYL